MLLTTVFPQKRKRVFIVAYNNTEIDVRDEANYAYETLFLKRNPGIPFEEESVTFLR